ncbi:hypothetical protein [Mesorhizobium shangrilense]|uniref:Uncharacterized protein n=1 Tax=Mesorhizobium shangrilense TaxID=460060 RepID=A0ABV2DMW4_9HYPH
MTLADQMATLEFAGISDAICEISLDPGQLPACKDIPPEVTIVAAMFRLEWPP